ncbi:MAG: ABC transporter ATP-binding protein [Candidatus Omnitrophica bacterium]|nr:ABC transporter ATP-binding protein [Candidatus Omnitrophota bacterium]MBU4488592.1 ABC transporter ATP-binding protein [Candidatus Omnitrophota bacterium]MCG2704472.1 ABC transporter ATP-binding protein [Candidatus Omnitrophota bacterium]
MEKIIEVKNLSKYYKNVMGEKVFKALDGISLDVEKGEIFGLLGPNGSGKTTLLKLLLGLIFPTSGRATVLGKSPRDVASKNRIGYLPEHPYYYDFLTPVELLGFYGSLGKHASRLSRDRIDYLIDKVGLGAFKNMRIRNFSKGMLQRIGLAISLVNDPEVLFLDEPTLGLDPIGTTEIENLLLELKSRGKTIFLSSHILSQVQDSCDSIAIIHKGKLIRKGRLKELLVSKDELSLTLRGPKAAESMTRLRAAAGQSGYEVVDVADKRDSLKDLFIKLIKEEAKK